MNAMTMTGAANPSDSGLKLWPLPGRVMVFLLLITSFRFWYCTRLELVGDEAYYWLWSKHLDYGYFSKGPGVAWTIALGTWLFGDTVFGIRFFAVALAAGTSLSIYVLARALFSEAIAWWSLVLGSVIPLFAVGSILMTIDPLSVFFWALAAVLFWRGKDEDSLGSWMLIGAAVGLGSLCKYTNLAQLACFALFCLWCPKYRRHFLKGTFPAMVLVALAALIPVLLWNQAHGWITLQHLAHRGALDRAWRFSLSEFSQFLGQQAAVISPLLFVGTLLASAKVSPPKNGILELRFLQSLFWPLFAFYTVLSFNDSGQPNWTAPCYASGVILLVSHWTEINRAKEWARRLAILALVLALSETIVLHDTSWLNLPPRRDPLSRVRGSEDLARQVAAFQEKLGARFIIANKYAYSSLLAFYLPQQPQTFVPTPARIENQFSFWPGYREKFRNESAIFVSDSDEIPAQLQVEFATVERIKETEAMHRGRPIKKFYLTLCRDLQAATDERR